MNNINLEYKKNIAPIIKWAGGKKQILPIIKYYIPKEISLYYEPFIGGGSVLFNLQPQKAIINDINSELINLYKVVKENVEELLKDLIKHKNEEEYFYFIRSLDRDENFLNKYTDVQRASRFIFLNKTCFNGMYRVNSRGYFNTPFGNYKQSFTINCDIIRAVNKYFNEFDIGFKNTDFENVITKIEKDTFVYFDPPYDTDKNNFTEYSKYGFDRNDQKRLKKLCDKLTKLKVKFLLSNSSTDFIMDLYKDYNIENINVKRFISADKNGRKGASEVLIKNY